MIIEEEELGIDMPRGSLDHGFLSSERGRGGVKWLRVEGGAAAR